MVVPGLSGLLLQGCIRKPPFDALALVLLNTDEPERSDQDGKVFVFFLCVAEERLLKSETAKETPFSPGRDDCIHWRDGRFTAAALASDSQGSF